MQIGRSGYSRSRNKYLGAVCVCMCTLVFIGGPDIWEETGEIKEIILETRVMRVWGYLMTGGRASLADGTYDLTMIRRSRWLHY